MDLKAIYNSVFIVFLTVTGVWAESSLAPPPNIRITTVNQLNNEEQVFICPTDSNIIIANWRDFRLGYRQTGIGRSDDGGLTWTDSLIRWSEQYFGLDSKQSDPTMTVAKDGTFYMSVLDWDAFGPTGESIIGFYKSTDKGISWTGPFKHVNHTVPGGIFEDKQFITVDRTSGIHSGNLYCSWTRFTQTSDPNRIMFIRSTNGGLSFDDTVTVGPNQTATSCGASWYSAGQLSIPIVTSNGNIHVFWIGTDLDSADCSPSSIIKHSVSSDGGLTFTYEDSVIDCSGYTSANGGVNTYSQPAGDADITGGPFDGNLYISLTNIESEDIANNSDVDFIKSTDNGLTWTDRIQINDAVASDLIDSFHPWLVVNEEGVLVVIFYDQRLNPPDYFDFDLFAAYSFDGGQSFTTNHRISDVSSSPFDLRSNLDLPPIEDFQKLIEEPFASDSRAGLIGEYIGVTAFHDKINAVWTDSRDGNSEVYTANWYIPILEPRLHFPDSGSFQNGTPDFGWATAWKHNEDQYRIEISQDPTFTSGVTSSVIDTNSFSQVSVLTEGNFYWRVKAFNLTNDDSSEYSAVRSFEVDTTPPAMADLLLPPDSIVTNNSNPSFVWSAVSRELSPVTYNLHISSDISFPEISTTTYSYINSTIFALPVALQENVLLYWKVEALDAVGNSSMSTTFRITYIDFICGDLDKSGADPNISDLTYFVNYLFKSGLDPDPLASSDLDGNGETNIADLTYMVNFMFKGGPPPNCP